MGRTRLSPQRLLETKKANIGRIIIFCEGKTEKHYFDYFAEIIKKNKYTSVEVFLESANGNAQTVLNYANQFMADEEHNRKFSTYGKYLAFDCDAPPNIQSVVSAAKEAEKYELLISNYLFETWLLMHFEDVHEKLSRQKTYRRLSEHLHGGYSKGHKGKTREIILNGSIEKAIDNAKALEKRYTEAGKSISICVEEMNPYTTVHTLIEQLMLEVSD